MKFTEFRKSYGDFEVVIPAIDFSSLTHDQAVEIVEALRAYGKEGYGWVCPRVNDLVGYEIGGAFKWCVSRASDIIRIQGLDTYLAEEYQDSPSFHPDTTAGLVLRKAWCEHLAREIEEHFHLGQEH